ncbi:MAG: peptide chain release factor N(5)-glutamine methyltransferase [Ruminococcaceae bacterium]|nr:peptide chain release factor N(5)-glutamine methyltransferase [Oscillospiraceae bacterium]
MTINEAITALGCSKRDAQFILAALLDKPESHILIHKSEVLTDEQRQSVLHAAERLAHGEPVQYVIGMWEFMSLPFYVGEGVLIPRGDTEHVCEKAEAILRKNAMPVLLDLCTGSGAIPIALVHSLPALTAYGVDISEKALEYARKNAKLNGVESRLTLSVADVMDKGFYTSNIFFDVITCNPPYIPTGDIALLDKSVQDFEPISALDGGADGLDFYRFISENALSSLKDGGSLIFEVGIGQATDVAEIMKRHGYVSVAIQKDYSGIERVVTGEKRRLS